MLVGSKTQALYDELCRRLETEWAVPGTGLPPELELAAQYRVSRTTLRRAFEQMVAEGKIVREANRGARTAAGEAVRSRKRAASRPAVTVAVLMAQELNAHCMELRAGLERYAREAKIELKAVFSSTGHDSVIQALEHIGQYGAEGVILFPHELPEYRQALSSALNGGVPVVCIDRYFPEIPTSYVTPDNQGGFYTVTNYMLTTYRRPAYFLSCAVQNTAQRDRQKGYRLAMEEMGWGAQAAAHECMYGGADSAPGEWTPDRNSIGARDAARALIRRASRPFSVVCMNDWIAKRFYEAAEEEGVVIGKDAMVAGFDDLPFSSILSPGLTTMRMPRLAMGFEAARTLHRMILEKVKIPLQLTLPMELVVRASA